MKHFKIVLAVICVLFLSIVSIGCGETESPQAEDNGKALLVYSGAGLQKPVEEIAALFEERTGAKVTFNFAGSSYLNNQILMSKKGDVYLPGDVSELEPIEKAGLVAEEKDVVYHIPVLAVPKGNPAGITSLADLKKEDIKVALGDPDTCPIGKLANKVLQDEGLLEAVNKNVVVRTPTISEMVVYLTTNQADAAIIWEENSYEAKDKIDIIPVPELENVVKVVPAAVLSCSENMELAKQLADLIASEEGYQIWQKWGYRPVTVK